MGNEKYFYLAYTLVWLMLAAYIVHLHLRIKRLEQR
jgi:CcmD family protein